jgi:hypothetical protein
MTRLLASAVTSVVLAATAMGAQSKATAPDITGRWGAYRPGRGAPDPKTIPPAPEPLVLKPQYAGPYETRRAAEAESDRRGEPLATPGTECLPYGMPNMMNAIYPMEFLQTPGQITIIGEAYSEVRRIYLNEPQGKVGDVEPGYYGHSVGHWDGDTLVVDTIGIKETVRGYRSMPHSDRMRITERIRLIATDVLQDQITIDDPVVLEKPVTYTQAYRRMPDYKMQEYVCENNREYVDDKGVTRIRLGDK